MDSAGCIPMQPVGFRLTHVYYFDIIINLLLIRLLKVHQCTAMPTTDTKQLEMVHTARSNFVHSNAHMFDIGFHFRAAGALLPKTIKLIPFFQKLWPVFTDFLPNTSQSPFKFPCVKMHLHFP